MFYDVHMSIQKIITDKIMRSLAPTHLDVINESRMHNVPPESESHFKLIIVSEKFTGQPLIDRHRTVNTVLADELKMHIHALTLKTLTPEEWHKCNQTIEASPPCLGGSKHEKK